MITGIPPVGIEIINILLETPGLHKRKLERVLFERKGKAHSEGAVDYALSKLEQKGLVYSEFTVREVPYLDKGVRRSKVKSYFLNKVEYNWRV